MLKKYLIVFVLITTCLFASYADYSDEIRKLGSIDQIARFKNDIVVKQISSYDTTGGNDDGFSGRFSFKRKENGKLIIADLKGSGIIHRIWTPTPSEDTIQFYFDGEELPRIELKFIDLFSGNKYPFLRPVSGNEIGGYYCYLPIPYSKSCKIAIKGQRLQFIQIQYSEYLTDQSFKSFPANFSVEEDLALKSILKIWEKSGSNLIEKLYPAQNNIKKTTKKIVLNAGETKSIFNANSGGRILGFEITPNQALNDKFKDLILKANWDNQGVLAINCPVGDFFGYAFGKPSMKSLVAGVSDNIHYFYLPMPFDKTANIEIQFLKNIANKYNEIQFDVTVYFTDQKRETDEGKFYSFWKRDMNPEIGKPYTILEKEGRGHHVGTILQSQGKNSGMTIFFEGDDQCYVDGELRLHGTGSEDYFNGGWYALADRWDQGFSLPVHGSLAYSIPLAHTGGYRMLLSDKISFNKSFSLSIEHGPEGNNIPVDYCSVAFYYCSTPPKSNNLPNEKLLSKLESPKLFEYWIQLLPVKALSEGAGIVNTFYKDSRNGKNINVLEIKAAENGFAKFELDVTENGNYKLYLSYFSGIEISDCEVYQRQIPIKKLTDLNSSENVLHEKHFIGNIAITEGTNTITLMLKGNNPEKKQNKFLLQRVFLEKI